MKKPVVHVSDHALLRYLERVGGFDIEGLRREIALKVRPAAILGASGVVIGKHHLVIRYEGDAGRAVVTTCRPAPPTQDP